MILKLKQLHRKHKQIYFIQNEFLIVLKNKKFWILLQDIYFMQPIGYKKKIKKSTIDLGILIVIQLMLAN